jgi:hypothetical protein
MGAVGVQALKITLIILAILVALTVLSFALADGEDCIDAGQVYFCE